MARPPKRRASSNVNAKHPQTTAKPTYAPDREPSLKERLTLPKRFHKAGEWPVNKILAERGGRYQIEWESHPKTGEVWKPVWVRNAFIRLWKYKLTCDRNLKQKSVTISLRSGRKRSRNHKTRSTHLLKRPVSRSAVGWKRKRKKANLKDGG